MRYKPCYCIDPSASNFSSLQSWEVGKLTDFYLNQVSLCGPGSEMSSAKEVTGDNRK